MNNTSSYEDLFGGLNYCTCEDCRTIFSPAAYFVDLFRLKDLQIIDPEDTNNKLTTRRPDLYKIVLSCANTNTLVPTLEIVNNILLQTSYNLSNEASKTYQELSEDEIKSIYQRLAEADYPFALPFHLPLTQLRTHLNMLNTDLPTIWQAWDTTTDATQVPAGAVAREILGLSPKEYELVITSDKTEDGIRAAYGLGSNIDPTDTTNGLGSIPIFLQQTGLNRTQLGELLFTDLSGDEISNSANKALFINANESDALTTDSQAQEPQDQFINLTLPKLDRIHRFIRLANKLGWSFTDLDWAVRTANRYDLSQDLDTALPILAQFKTWQTTYQKSINELCVMVGQIKTTGQKEGTSFFEQIFDPSLNTLGLPDETKTWQVTATAEQETDDDRQAKALLMGALGVSENLLQVFAESVLSAFDLEDGQLPLGIHQLSALYRLSQAQQWLNVPTSDAAIMLAQNLSHTTYLKPLARDITSTEDVQRAAHVLNQLADLQQWQQTMGISLDQLACILTGNAPISSSLYLSTDKAINFINTLYTAIQTTLLTPKALQSNPDLQLQSTNGEPIDLLAHLKKQDWVDDKGIIHNMPTTKALTAWLENLRDIKVQKQATEYRHRLAQRSKKGVHDASIDTKALAATLHTLLTHYHQLQAQTLNSHLASQFGVSNDAMTVLQQWVLQASDISALNQSLLPLLLQPVFEHNFNAITNLDATSHAMKVLQACNSYATLTIAFNLSKPELQSILEHPELYGMADLSQNLTLASLLALAEFKTLVNTYQDRNSGFIRYLEQVKAAHTDDDLTNNAQTLAKLTQWDAPQLQQLITDLWPNAAGDDLPAYGTIAGLMQLKTCFDLSTQTGLSTTSLQQLHALQADTTTYDQFATQADQLLSVVKAKYATTTTWDKVYEPIAKALNEQKRDALAPYVMQQLKNEKGMAMATLRALSEYLLTDVEVTGVVTTSLIKEGTLAFQTYINRCRMGLEPGVTFENRAELERLWAWMDTTTLWEANRKVFLYPENYIDPAARKDTTDLFQQLTQSLQQTHITQDTVTQAVTTYVDSFAEVANLEYAGSYLTPAVQDADDPTRHQQTLYLLSRTQAQPATYYYRTSQITTSSSLTQQQELPEDSNSVILGESKVAISGNVAIVGGGYHSNKAYTYYYNGTQWTKQQELDENTDHIGQSVGISGDLAIVGISGARKACIYHYDGTRWNKQQELTREDIDNQFGSLVDISGNFAIVSAPKVNKAYIYHYDGTNWNESQELTEDNSYYGYPVAISGNFAIVGAWGANKVYIYHYDGTQWTQPQELTEDGKSFGQSVGISGDVVIVGTDNRKAYIYHYDGTQWTQSQELTEDGRGFGQSVAISGHRALVGSQYDERKVYIYHYNGTQWTEQEALTQNISNFGSSVGISGDLAIVGTGTKSYGCWLPLVKQALWSPYTKIDLNIPATYPSPIYAFDKLFVFWVNITPSPADHDNNGQVTQNRFEATLYYSFYNFNKNWVAPQQLGDAIVLPNTVTTQAQAQTLAYQRVGLAFENNQILVSYRDKTFALDINLKPTISNSETPTHTLPNPTGIFGNLPAGTTNYPIAGAPNTRWSILDTGTSEYLCIPAGANAEQTQCIRLNSATIHTLSSYLFSQGIDKLLSVAAQNTLEGSFKALEPTDQVATPWPTETLDFNGANGLYYWELFFHTPFLAASTLNTQQQFQDAQTWYQYIYNPTIAIPTPQNSWPLNEGTGSSLQDTTGHATGTLQGNATWQADTTFPLGPRNVLVFDGSTNYITLPEDTTDFSNGLTITGWVYFDAFKDYDAIIMLSDEAGNNKIVLSSEQKCLRINIWNDSTQHSLNATTEIPLQQWTYVMATIDPAGKATLYINGQEEASSQNMPLPNPQAIRTKNSIGKQATDDDDNFFQGKIANLCLWNQSFSSDEVVEAYPNDTYWRFVGLRTDHNPTLLTELTETPSEELEQDLANSTQIAAYEEDPYDPHAIATLRPIAYQKSTVMHYISNLMDWGDNRYRQNTRETLAEATLLYMAAYDLLGQEPEDVGACPLPDADSVSNIELDVNGHIPEFLIEMEQSTPTNATIPMTGTPNNWIADLSLYFGIPENEQFTSYWTLVQSRLYNLRNNLTLDGQPNNLPLFEPPIDPTQLVNAVAAGQGTSSAMAAGQMPIPYYRFEVMVQKAKEVISSVTQLGSALLSALEKQDAEALAQLHSTHEQSLLNMTLTLKQDQITAAEKAVTALQSSLQNAQDRADHYTALIKQGLSTEEKQGINLQISALAFQSTAAPLRQIASVSHWIPTIFGLADGGYQPGSAMSEQASVIESIGNIMNSSSALTSTRAQYQRREEDWTLQQTLAKDDLDQINAQIEASQVQVAMAKHDLAMLQQNITQQQAVLDFLKTKFTNQQLYQWMIGKLSALYFQTYQLAYNWALGAQQAWQFERGDYATTFVNPGHWDDLHQGLLAGEGLLLDVQQMEKSYIDQDVRKLEIVKTISLAQLDPQALLELQNTGSCTFDLMEKDFDWDYPGHYCRQIKTLSLTFPALVGPYQNVHATLTQTSSKTLLKADEQGVQYLLTEEDNNKPDNTVLSVNVLPNQQVALSQGLNDSGLFQLNFNDARYLPFEGTGAISSWQLDMPKAYNPIDFTTLTDVIIEMRYTALAQGGTFQNTVIANLEDFSGSRYLSMAQTFPSAWHGFIQQQEELVFTLSPALLRPNLSSYQVSGIYLQLVLTPEGVDVDTMPTVTITPEDGTAIDLSFTKDENGVVSASQTDLSIDLSTAQTWTLSVKDDSDKLLTPDNVSNMVMALTYTAKAS